MKVLFFWMDGCPHCTQIKESMKDIPEAKKFIAIERKNVSSTHKQKYEIKSYPTLVFLTDDNRMIRRKVGVMNKEEIELAYRGANRLDKLFKRTGKLY